MDSRFITDAIDAPRIEGLRFRRLRRPDDYAAMASVHASCAPADDLDEVLSAETMATFIEHPMFYDPEADVVIAEVAGTVIGYAFVTHRVEAAGDGPEGPEGDNASYPGGDRAERPEGDNASYPEGDRPERPEGDSASYPKGDRAERPEGDNASYPEGDRPERPEGDSASYPKGDEVHTHRGYVVPSWRRRGLGSALLSRVIRRSIESRILDTGASTRWLQSYVSEGEVGSHALLKAHGYAPFRYAFKMARDLADPIPDLPMPEGVEIRPAEPAHFRRIWEAEREAFQDHWGYTPWPEENYQRFLAFPYYDPSLWRVAWDGDQVAGSVLSYIDPKENERFGRLRGYTEDITVRRPWRKRGLASALIARSLEALRQRGMTEAALEVDAENPTGALRVYERLGFNTTKRRSLYRRPLTTPASSGD
jgi:mycothiol synthase